MNIKKLAGLAVAAGLSLTLLGSTPAHAQVAFQGPHMDVVGTVMSVANNVCSIYTPQGIVSVPLNQTSFYMNGAAMPWQKLAYGQPVEAVSLVTYGYTDVSRGLYPAGVQDWSDGWWDESHNWHPRTMQ
jgi:hypothetical protein